MGFFRRSGSIFAAALLTLGLLAAPTPTQAAFDSLYYSCAKIFAFGREVRPAEASPQVLAWIKRYREIRTDKAFQKQGLIPTDFYKEFLDEAEKDIAAARVKVGNWRPQLESKKRFVAGVKGNVEQTSELLQKIKGKRYVTNVEVELLGSWVSELNSLARFRHYTDMREDLFPRFFDDEFIKNHKDAVLRFPPGTVLFPTYTNLSLQDINALTPHGLHPLGMARGKVNFDGVKAGPAQFYFHDLNHAQQVARNFQNTPYETRVKLYENFQKFLGKMETPRERRKMEVIWFYLSHEVDVPISATAFYDSLERNGLSGRGLAEDLADRSLDGKDLRSEFQPSYPPDVVEWIFARDRFRDEFVKPLLQYL